MDQNEHSVTYWILQLKQNQPDAAQQIWERYYTRLVEVARAKLRTTDRRLLEGEDVASRVIENLWNGIQKGQFPTLNDRNDLWHILLMLTERRSIDAMRQAGVRRKREIGESSLFEKHDADSARLSNLVEDRFADQQFVHDFHADLEQLLTSLGDERLKEITNLKLQGFTNAEISAKLICAERTIERKLALIREKMKLQLLDD